MSNPSDPDSLTPTRETTQNKQTTTCLLTPDISLRPGIVCPRCGKGKIDYNGLLQLVCPNCGLTEAGACT